MDFDAVGHELDAARGFVTITFEQPQRRRLIFDHGSLFPNCATISCRSQLRLEYVILPPRISSISRMWYECRRPEGLKGPSVPIDHSPLCVPVQRTSTSQIVSPRCSTCTICR